MHELQSRIEWLLFYQLLGERMYALNSDKNFSLNSDSNVNVLSDLNGENTKDAFLHVSQNSLKRISHADQSSSLRTWDDGEELTEERREEAQKKITESGEPLSDFQRQRLVNGYQHYWENFYKSHTNKFFKDRHYLELDFLILNKARTSPLCALEMGSGTGATCLPLMERLEGFHCMAFDLSPTAIDLSLDSPIMKCGRGIFFPHNACSTNILKTCQNLLIEIRKNDNLRRSLNVGPLLDRLLYAPLLDRGFDVVIMIYMLSAMGPEYHRSILLEAFLALRPGGQLLFRDYGMYDQAQLRFKKGHKLNDQLFVRSDQTLAYYFSVEELANAAISVGFEIVDCRYLYRKQRTSGGMVEMDRIFVHAIFRKPVDYYV